MNLYKVHIHTKDKVKLGFLVPARDIKEAKERGMELATKWQGYLYFVDELRNERITEKLKVREEEEHEFEF